MHTLLIIITTLVAVLICVGCLLPPHLLPARLPNDKLMHLVSYFLLMVLLGALTRNLLLFAALLFLAGLLIECLQHFVPGRYFSWRDQLANTVGLRWGWWCEGRAHRSIFRRLTKPALKIGVALTT